MRPPTYLHISPFVLAAGCSLAQPGSELVSPLQQEAALSDANFGGCGCIGVRCDIRHLGSDLFVEVGTTVYAVADGVVVFRAGPDQEAGWGDGLYAVFVLHHREGHPFVALYGHIQTQLDVGGEVRAGAVIGEVGRYEETYDGQTQVYPSHLHFGIHPGAEMPRGPTGLSFDPMCEGGSTHGWVAPVHYLSGGSAEVSR